MRQKVFALFYICILSMILASFWGTSGCGSNGNVSSDSSLVSIPLNTDSRPHLDINGLGQMVFSEMKDNITKIYLYDNDEATLIASVTGQISQLQINDNGQIVWDTFDGTNGGLYLYDNGRTTQFIETAGPAVMPYINSLGEVVWTGSMKIIFHRSLNILKAKKL